ncbi:MAG: AAA family ATPase [Bacteroidales bacterium]|jgi:predicted AAA+ superfamily ATPase|nr:AAA family ATPase [Bacteroidales bacterium]
MDILKEKHRKKVAGTSLGFVRSTMDRIDWNQQLTGIRGARGVGKTTLLLQYIARYHSDDPLALYASLDDIYFSGNRLSDVAGRFAREGGRRLFLDEVHKYPFWSRELKNIYDDIPELKVVFTGSSLLEIMDSRADLSRRAVVYTMQGLSYREYLGMAHGINLPAFSLGDILTRTYEITGLVNGKIKPLQYFFHYLATGYYPFFLESETLYPMRVEEVVKMIIEMELPLLRGVDVAYTGRLKQLLLIIAQSAPFVPNVTKLSERIGINRNTLIAYLGHLQEAGLTRNLYKDATGITILQKPEKIFLENSNLAFSLTNNTPESGSMRETFFANQVGFENELTYPENGDFRVNDRYLFEVGGKKKGKRQIQESPNSFIAADDIEFGFGNKIPLWLFGFLY